MIVESAADRAAMFSDGGEAAQYTPPAAGAALDCNILLEHGRPAPYEFGPGGDSGMVGAYALESAQILVDEVPVVAAGGLIVPGTRLLGTFTPGPDSYKVVGRPRLDDTGALWIADLQKVAP